jgi:hypothetical protein
MTAPPPHFDEPDEITEAYRRASERDPARPGIQVRTAILKEVARTAQAQRRALGGSWIGHWKWQAAASVAVAGLIGILSSLVLRSPEEKALEHRHDSVPVVIAPAAPSAPAAVAPTIRAPVQMPLAIEPRVLPASKAPAAERTVTRASTAPAARAAPAAPAAPAARAAPAAPPADVGLQEVIVTGERRAENLQEVPVAVSAFSSSALSKSGIGTADIAVPDPTVIGRPSPVQGAISTQCKQPATLTRLIDCDKISGVLQTLVQEARDSDWAARAEAQLRKAVAADPSTHDFTVRALECRTTLCVLEIAAPGHSPTTLDIAHRLPLGDGPLVAFREPELSWVDHESSGRPTLVDVAVFVRR